MLVTKYGNFNKYENSLVSVKISISSSLDYIFVDVMNLTEDRMTIEWENARISGTKIAFIDDLVYQLNMPRQDEVLTRHGITFKLVCKRYSTRLPIVDKKKLKKEGPQKFYFLLPLSVNSKTYDIDTTWIVEMIK